MKVNLLILLFAFVFAIAGCNQKTDEQTQSQTKSEDAALQTTMDTNTENKASSVTPSDGKNSNSKETKSDDKATQKDTQKYPIVTFIELGSVNCVPCKKMQPIMKSLESKYGEQLKVIFYDVWKDEFKDKGKEYGIKLIPTQVFLDADGKEIHRHEGYYPEEEIDKFLQSKGLVGK
jgi:thioredoxin 1